MGWSYRKSYRLGGGLRLNVSKSGLGLSAGVKGTRVSFGPRGTRLYSGFGPFRYQSSLSRKAMRTGARQGRADPRLAPLRPEPSKLPGFLWAAALCSLFAGAQYFAVGVLVAILGTIFDSKSRAFRLLKKALKASSPEEEVVLLAKAFEACPKVAYQFLYGVSLANHGDFAEALIHLRPTVHEVPTPEGQFLLGKCLAKTGNYEEALEVLGKVDSREASDEYVEALLLKAECHFEKKDFDKCLDAIRSVMSSRGEESADFRREARLLRAKTFLETGRRADALREVKQLIADAPGFDKARELLTTLEISPKSSA